MTSMNFLIRRSLATAATVGAVLLMAGCGSSSPGSGANKAVGANGAGGAKTSTGSKTSSTGGSSTTPPAAPPSSGTVLAAGLVKAMAKSQRQLTDVKARCPGGHLTHYPVTCHFTATEVVKKFKKTYHMVGTITVASSQGGNYSYGLNYAPTK